MSPFCETQKMHFLNIPTPASGDLPPEEQSAPLNFENPPMEITVVGGSRGRRRGDNHHRCRCPFPHSSHKRRDSSDDENDDDDHYHHNDDDDRLSVLEEEEVMRRTKATTSKEEARRTSMEVPECLPWVQIVPNDITTNPTRHQQQHQQIHHHHYYHHHYYNHPSLLQHNIPPTSPHLYHQQQITTTTTTTIITAATTTTSSSSSSLHPYHQYHYHHHNHPATTTNTSSVSSSPLVARSAVPNTSSSPAGEPTSTSPCVTSTGQCQDTIPQFLRENAKQYILQQLQVNERRPTTDMLETVQKFITSLEDQVYCSVASQEEYISKLATRLAAILAHLPTRRFNSPSSKSPMRLHNASSPTCLRHHQHHHLHPSSSSSHVPAATSDLHPVAVSPYSVGFRSLPST